MHWSGGTPLWMTRVRRPVRERGESGGRMGGHRTRWRAMTLPPWRSRRRRSFPILRPRMPSPSRLLPTGDFHAVKRRWRRWSKKRKWQTCPVRARCLGVKVTHWIVWSRPPWRLVFYTRRTPAHRSWDHQPHGVGVRRRRRRRRCPRLRVAVATRIRVEGRRRRRTEVLSALVLLVAPMQTKSHRDGPKKRRGPL